jgi:transketolase
LPVLLYNCCQCQNFDKGGILIDTAVKKQLVEMARRVRVGIIESTYGAKAGHPGGSLSSAEVFTYLYFREMNIDPENPKMDNRDRFVLSKGHCSPGLYSVLANRGFFPVEDLPTFRHIDSYLQGHPSMTSVPGVDMSTGSLGQGVSTACGMALGLKKRGGPERVYALLGDGELQEGQVWEALMFGAHYSLDNLCIIIDNNNLQIDGAITDVMNPYPIREKLEAFGYAVFEVDGHSFEELEQAFNTARNTKGKPSAILMKTIKGKGISYMENKAAWHGKAPNDDEYKTAIDELSQAAAAEVLK